jgi:hypothetical protein
MAPGDLRMPIDERVAGFLGRVLNNHNDPIGTCFQVAERVIITAWHVIDDIGAASINGAVKIDPLRGGDVIEGRVVALDPIHDLAVLQTAKALPDVVPGLKPSDKVAQRAQVSITGAPHVEDSYSYLFLDAPGEWAGGTTRSDNVQLGRVTADAVMKGMSGAPVISTEDRMVVGVVSGRYNSDDGWLRDSVWIARVEDLTSLLAERSDADVRRATASMLIGPLPTKPWCLVLTAETLGPVRLMDRVTDVISRFMDEAPVFDTIHESPIELSVVDALRTAENWQVAVEAVTKADCMVADVSGFEPGVMLLLGLRSVVRRGVTLSVSRRFRDAADARETPFNVQETRVIPYDTNEFYMRLSEALREGVASLHSDLNYLDLPAYHAVRTPRSEGWA